METYLEWGSASADKSTLMERVMTLFYGKVLRGGGGIIKRMFYFVWEITQETKYSCEQKILGKMILF